MQQQPHFHSNITLFSGCQGDTYCCHFPVPCLYNGCKEQPQNMELSLLHLIQTGGAAWLVPDASAPSPQRVHPTGKRVPGLLGAVPSSCRGEGRGLPIQAEKLELKAESPHCMSWYGSALTSEHWLFPTTAPAYPIKNSPSHKKSVFPKNESSLPHFLHSTLLPPCSRYRT